MTWPDTISDALRLQEQHRKLVKIAPLKKEPEFVAGVDAAFDEDCVCAAACLYRYRELTLVERETAVRTVSFPYVPGYLFFREGPAIIAALKKLSRPPEVILVDGHGIAHPRGIGSASHLGVLLGIPTIGCAKTRLVGTFKEPGSAKENWSPLKYEGSVVGAVLRTRDDVRPLYVSPGHEVDVDGAIHITLACCGKYRIPEPLRCADMLSRKMRSLG